MKFFISFAFVILSHGLVTGQPLSAFLKSNAIEINVADSTENTSLLEELKKFRLIMMGEMHGTQEPAQFVSYVVGQLIRSGIDVQLGIELPESMVGDFVRQPTRENLRNSDFFSRGYQDGRASEAWFELILKYHGRSKVKVFFYDQEQGNSSDSLMYEKVKSRLAESSQSVIVLLGGNFHNRTIPSRSGKPMGVYFYNDKTLENKVCAVNHHYKYGTMMNSFGAGLQLRTIEAAPTHYSEATPFKAYFSLLPENTSPYTAIFYSETVTASEILNISK